MGRLKTILMVLVLGVVLLAASPPAQYEPEPPPYPVVSQSYHYWVQNGIGYYMLAGDVIGEFDDFVVALQIFERYHVKKIVIYLNSPGGSLFEGLGFAQLMIEQRSKGMLVEVRCYGLAASAAAIILACGTPGHRYIADSSFVMVHELWVFKLFSVQSVSQVEKEAKVMRKLQNAMIQMLSRHIKLSPEELKRRCAEETWISAQQAIEWGFADHLIQ